MRGIKKQIKDGSSKTVITKDGRVIEKTTRTNAINPNSLTGLGLKMDILQRAREIPIRSLPSKPITREVPIEKRYKDIAGDLGICPYELREILNAEYSSDDTLVFSLLKKFVSAVKLSGHVDLSSTHKMLKEHDEHQKQQEINWLNTCASLNKANQEAADRVTQAEQEVRNSWTSMLIDLVQKIDVNPNLDSLGEMDKLSVMAIQRLTRQDGCKVDNKGNISIEFNKIKNLPFDAIGKMPTTISRIKDEIKEAKWHKLLIEASTQDLMSELWNLNHNQSDYQYLKESLEWEIASRNRRPISRNRNDNAGWYTTMFNRINNDPLDDDSW